MANQSKHSKQPAKGRKRRIQALVMEAGSDTQQADLPPAVQITEPLTADSVKDLLNVTTTLTDYIQLKLDDTLQELKSAIKTGEELRKREANRAPSWPSQWNIAVSAAITALGTIALLLIFGTMAHLEKAWMGMNKSGSTVDGVNNDG